MRRANVLERVLLDFSEVSGSIRTTETDALRNKDSEIDATRNRVYRIGGQQWLLEFTLGAIIGAERSA